MKKNLWLLLLLCSIVTLCACSTDEAQTIYATSISFITQSLSREVGDEVALSSILKVEPYKAEIDFLDIENPAVASYNAQTGILSCIGAGETTVTARANTQDDAISGSFSLFVSNKPNYATAVSFDVTSLEVNYNETQTNHTNLLLQDLTNIDYVQYSYSISENMTVVTYSRVGIVDYDPLSGIVTPLTGSSSIESVTVTVRVKTGKLTTTTGSFDVEVTNYVYATDIDLLNINFYQDDSGIWQSNTITLFSNTELNLGYGLTPSNCNFEPTLTSLSDAIVVQNGLLVTGDEPCEQAKVVVSIPSGKNTVLQKILNIQIVVPTTQMTITLTDFSGNEVSTVFVGIENYYLTVSHDGSVEGNTISYLDSILYQDFYTLTETQTPNVYLISFTSADFANEKIRLECINTDYNGQISIYSNNCLCQSMNQPVVLK